MDYRGLGFRECLAETARYLSIIEGLDNTDPLRIRLVSHLSNYATQREAHTGLGHLAWGSAFSSPHLAHHLLLPQHQQGASLSRKPSSAPSSSSSSPSSSPSAPSSEPHGCSRLPGTVISEAGQSRPLRVAPTAGAIPPGLTAASASKLSPPLLTSLSSLSAFPFPLSAFPLISPHTTPSSSLGKPYRPWSMEIGAFWSLNPDLLEKLLFFFLHQKKDFWRPVGVCLSGLNKVERKPWTYVPEN